MARNERGQGLVEYALLLALVAIVAIAALLWFGRNVYTLFYGITEALQFGCGQVSNETFRSYAGVGGPAPEGGLEPGWPAVGTITQSYWFCHKGLDIAADEGTPVQAVAAGQVEFAGWSDKGYGYMVVIDHGSYQTLYAHLQPSLVVTSSQVVLTGTTTLSRTIGSMGNTGFSTGPHLHFEIRVGSDLVDPASYLR